MHASVFDCRGAAGPQNDQMTVFQLPKQTVPISYKLKIDPEYDETSYPDIYDGEVEILIAAKSETSVITLNCKNLTVDMIYLSENESRRNIEVEDWYFKPNNEQLMIPISVVLNITMLYTLDIQFRGTIGSDMVGFFNSMYHNQDGLKE